MEKELAATLLCRHGMTRRWVTPAEARSVAMQVSPDLVMIDRDIPEAGQLVSDLRENPNTRKVSIAVVARGDFDGTEVELLEAGANAVLRLPPDREWDERLIRLIDVPARKERRFPVELHVEAQLAFENAPVRAETLNLSVNGALLDISEPLPVGQTIELRFLVFGLSDAVHAQGRVVRQARPRGVGVEFTKLSDDDLKRLRDCLADEPVHSSS